MEQFMPEDIKKLTQAIAEGESLIEESESMELNLHETIMLEIIKGEIVGLKAKRELLLRKYTMCN